MNATIYKCFIASPSDTTSERDCCDEVFSEINKTLGDSLSARIETVRWENDAHPALGDRGQGIINNQLKPEECDFFIAILKNKFGTPTSLAPSGTVEEFNRAYDNFKRNKNPKILVYFYDGTVERNQIPTEDIEKIEDFKRQIQELGLYSTFSGSEDFKQKLRHDIIKTLNSIREESERNTISDNVSEILEERLNNALSIFSDFKIQWIERYLCKSEDVSDDFNECFKYSISPLDILATDESCIIKAPPQFGLTCLSHYIVLNAWKKDRKSYIYLDYDDISIKDIAKNIIKELEVFNSNVPDAIVLDSWALNKSGFQKKLEIINSLYPQVRLIIMQTETDSLRIFENANVKIQRDFVAYNLLSLPKKEIRLAVESCQERFSLDTDTILKKITNDMEVLNIHRTPMNCWSLLKVAESSFDTGPINRTHMLELLLIALFSLYKVPNYNTIPDAKDCEHVLGAFCGKILQDNEMSFSKKYFYDLVNDFCDEHLIDIDIDIVWEILIANRIIIHVLDHDFRFKSSFWIYFFAAKRMSFDAEFKTYILSDKNYANFPEVIEFFTGIDRNKTEILELLSRDLKETHAKMITKIGLPAQVLNPLKLLRWEPKEQDVDKMKSQLSETVSTSRVPTHIKDQHADSTYNHLQPYNQDINKFLENSSFLIFVSQLKALSRALRNSDYATVDTRKKVFSEIIFYWTEISKILFFVSPILAQRGNVAIEGYFFQLDKSFNEERFKNTEDLFLQIVKVNPSNVINFVKNDLSSERIGSLINNFLTNNPNALAELLLMLFLISERPSKWHEILKKYIQKQEKNSFYLYCVFTRMVYYCELDYINSQDYARMRMLIKDCLEKQTAKKIKTADDLKSFIPNFNDSRN